jgi:hypothetical protein
LGRDAEASDFDDEVELTLAVGSVALGKDLLASVLERAVGDRTISGA